MNSDYVLVSRWRLVRSREVVWGALEALLATGDPLVWWPSVRVEGYDGSSMRVRAASMLGYSLAFTLSDLEAVRPTSLSFAARGDLRGSGTVSFEPAETTTCSMTIDWRVTADRRWMRSTAWVLRPAFVLAHRVVMRQGRRRFNAWLDDEGWRGRHDIV